MRLKGPSDVAVNSKEVNTFKGECVISIEEGAGVPMSNSTRMHPGYY